MPVEGEVQALLQAAQAGQAEQLEQLLREGVDAGARNELGEPALLLASRAGKPELVRLLLEAGAPVDSADPKGRTPLMVAAAGRHLGVTELLLGRGANVRARSLDDEPVSFFAAQPGNAEIVRRLLTAGAEVNEKAGPTGITLLMLAASLGDAECVEAVLECGADPTARDATGWTALDWALQSRNRENAQYLRDWLQLRPNPLELYLDSVRKFPEVAATPAYQEFARGLARETGGGAEAWPGRAGVLMFRPVRPCFNDFQQFGEAFDLWQSQARQAGLTLILSEWPGDGRPKPLLLFPTPEKYAVVAAFGTNAAKYYRGTLDVIRFLQQIEATDPFWLFCCGFDFVAGRFAVPVVDETSLARRLVEFCPDILASGGHGSGQVAEQIRDLQAFHLWWG